MEAQKIVNILKNSDNELSKFATKNWYVIHDQNGTEYGESNVNSTRTKFDTKRI